MPLGPNDLRRILTDVRGSLVSQYTALFGYSGIEIKASCKTQHEAMESNIIVKFTSDALDAICAKAAERGGGARGLRGIMVRVGVPANDGADGMVRHRRRCCSSRCSRSRECLVCGCHSSFLTNHVNSGSVRP
jgi:ATP-dependent Clp protease ATP-binding subunit ClpX